MDKGQAQEYVVYVMDNNPTATDEQVGALRFNNGEPAFVTLSRKPDAVGLDAVKIGRLVARTNSLLTLEGAHQVIKILSEYMEAEEARGEGVNDIICKIIRIQVISRKLIERVPGQLFSWERGEPGADDDE